MEIGKISEKIQNCQKILEKPFFALKKLKTILE